MPKETTAPVSYTHLGVFGIDSAYLEEINKTLNLPIDTSAFEQGKVVLLSKTVEGLIQPGQELSLIHISIWAMWRTRIRRSCAA